MTRTWKSDFGHDPHAMEAHQKELAGLQKQIATLEREKAMLSQRIVTLEREHRQQLNEQRQPGADVRPEPAEPQ
jgi:hypothetical protein